MLQKALSILLTLFALSMILLIYRDNNTYSIGIIQAFNHPTLDITRQGFTDQIDRSDLKNSRNIKIANLVIENGKLVFKDSKKPFTPKNINLILTISSQSLYELLQTNYNIPIIFLAVSDLDFIETNLLRNNKMITGISDITPIESQFKLLTKLLPSINKIGVIYNPEEKLSRLQINLIKKFSSSSGIQCIYEQVNTNELAVQAAKNLLGEIDALYIPSDKTVTPVIQEIITWTDLANIPIISGDERGVEQGALCTVIVDYYKLGQEAGKIAINALTKQINIKDYPVETSKNNRIVININKAKKLNIVIPNEVKEAIEH